MGKIAVLVYSEEMLSIAEGVIKEGKAHADFVEQVSSAMAAERARALIDDGAGVIVARGLQAKLIKQYTNVPIVEIKLTAQEIGLVIQEAKGLLGKEHPTIGLVAFSNMLSDLTHIEELLGVRLIIATIEKKKEISEAVKALRDKGVELIIGGEVTIRVAKRENIPTLFYSATEESILTAMRTAKTVLYAQETEKSNNARMQTVIDTSSREIFQIDEAGTVLMANAPAKQLLQRIFREEDKIKIQDLIPDMDTSFLGRLFKAEEYDLTEAVVIKDNAYMMSAIQIYTENKVEGVIVLLDRLEKEQGEEQKRWLKGFETAMTFKKIVAKSPMMKEVIHTASVFALSDEPILLMAGEGLETKFLAGAIHNSSSYYVGPFIQADCSSIPGDNRQERLKEIILKATGGTLFLENIDSLSLEETELLYQVTEKNPLIKNRALSIGDGDVRLVAAAKTSLRERAEKGEFSEKLLFHMQPFTIRIPSLNERIEDLLYYTDYFTKHFGRKYGKYPHLTNGAYEEIKKIQWTGNIMQLKIFLERLVLSLNKRTVDETMVYTLFNQLYALGNGGQGERTAVKDSP